MQTSSWWKNKAETIEKGHNLTLGSAVPFYAKTESKATHEKFHVTPSLCHTDPITSSCPLSPGSSSPSAEWAEISTATAALGSQGRTLTATLCTGRVLGMLPDLTRQCLSCTAHSQHPFSKLKYIKVKNSEKSSFYSICCQDFVVYLLWKEGYRKSATPYTSLKQEEDPATSRCKAVFCHSNGNAKWQILSQLKQ